MSLSIRNLTKSYGKQNAVDNLSFEVSKGQILGFLGPNGAGKSTTMKIISCYLTPTSGTAIVCDHDVTEAPNLAKQHIGYLPEHNPLYLDMYVKEYLSFVANVHKLKNSSQRINEVIELTGLGKEQHKLIGSLSKGYRQRVGLAQAIMHDPDILILDEPTSGLDMNQLVDIRDLIKKLGKDKIVILSTHIMQEVEALCDRVIIINNGQLVADDPIDRLKEKARGEQIILIQLLEEAVELDVFKKIAGVSNVSIDNGHISIKFSQDEDIRPAIFNTIVCNNWTLLEMKKEIYNVEHIFQQLTQKNA